VNNNFNNKPSKQKKENGFRIQKGLKPEHLIKVIFFETMPQDSQTTLHEMKTHNDVELYYSLDICIEVVRMCFSIIQHSQHITRCRL
jgi:hypothetical protein